MNMTQRRTARVMIIALTLLLAAGSLGYRWLTWHHLEQTSAMFIGLPAILAIAIAMLPQPKSATGTILKTLSLFLLLSGILLGEGFICILMAAPLVLGVGCLVGMARDREQRRRGVPLMALPLIVLMGVEGTTPQLSFPREEQVSVEKTIAATPSEIRTALATTPQFRTTLPLYLRLKFPLPGETSGSGLQEGALRVVRFAGGEGKPGNLVMRVGEADDQHVRFDAVSDTSHIAHWLKWEEARVDLTEVAAGQTRVRWTLRYRRDLDPAWYFGPWERYAARLAAGYLIDNVATPHPGRP